MKTKPIIVTLTTIPPRFPNLLRKLASLERQTVKPDQVEIYIPRKYRRFPDADIQLPKLPSWASVVQIEEDMGPATKILPAAKKWRGEDVDLLLCDDDRIEDPQWISRFALARQERPKDIICEVAWNVDERFGWTHKTQDLPRAKLAKNRGRTLDYKLKKLLTLGLYQPPFQMYETSGYSDIFMGVHGALVPPQAFHEDAWTIPDIVWTVDDVWLSGMAKANGYSVWVNAASRPIYRDGKFDKVAALKNFVEQGIDRSGADRMCVDMLMKQYGIWA